MRYRANVTIYIEYESDSEPHAHIIKHMDGVLPADCEFSVSNVCRVRNSVRVLGEFSPDEVFPHVAPKAIRSFQVGEDVYNVRLDSHRYFLFANNPKCVACGLEGVKFLLELPKDYAQPHFNFYAVEHGQLVLMTKDHIVCKAHGGGNVLSNYQTLCTVCNRLKGSTRLSVEGIATLRKIYNELRRGYSRQHLVNQLHKARRSLALPIQPGERQGCIQKTRAMRSVLQKVSGILFNTHPLTISKTANGLIATAGRDGDIGIIIEAHTELEATGQWKQRSVEVRLPDGSTVFVYHGLLRKRGITELIENAGLQEGQSPYNVVEGSVETTTIEPEISNVPIDPPSAGLDW